MSVIVKPLISEKMTAAGEKLKQFGFIVDKRANKLDIKKAVEDLYSVQVKDVNTMVYAGKRKVRGSKRGFVSGRTNSFKKAIVTLNEGQIIDFYSNI